MSKSILVIDTPKSCSECHFKKVNIYDDTNMNNFDFYCELDKLLHNTNAENFRTKRHPQCPLKDTSELLEALEEIGNELITIHSPNIRQYKINKTMSYNNLYKALGGNKNE